MRDILFRGKRLDNGEWVYGYVVKAKEHFHKRGIHEDYIITSARSNGGYFVVNQRYAVDPETVGQYTGLKDNNGVKIFEDDIVAYEDEAPGQYEYHDSLFINRGVIKYCEGSFYFTNAVAANLQDFVYKGVLDCMVVGNIYDNPQILESEAEANAE